MNNELAHIAVFAFNRPQHLARSLTALAGNQLAQQSNVTVFCDAPRTDRDRTACDAVRGVAAKASGFSSVRVVLREENLGCARSVITGLGEVFAEHDRVVVIEDDIVASPSTLTFLNRALDHYATAPCVFSIGAWVPPHKVVSPDYRYNAFFYPRFQCWGWASWADRWAWNDWTVPGYDDYRQNSRLRQAHRLGGDDLPAMLDAQMAGKIDSWAIRAEYTRFRCGAVTVYPRTSLVKNIGMDGTGRHAAATTRYDSVVGGTFDIDAWPFPDHVYLDREIVAAFRRMYAPASLLSRIGRRLQRVFSRSAGWWPEAPRNFTRLDSDS